MPAYRFEAINTQGKSSKGLLDADSARAVRGLLRAQNLIPLKVDLVQKKSGTGLNREIWSRPALSKTELTIWTRQLSGLVSSGLTL